ncbi:MAG: adenylate/guanylate cyclase domain-containing protein [Syntrophales bacterium]
MVDRNRIFSISPLKISIAIVLCAGVLYFLNFSFLQFLELKALDLRMRSRGERPQGEHVVIAAIDEKSLGELGRWPWSRTTVAHLVDALKRANAKAVGFDVVFAEADGSGGREFEEIALQVERIGIRDSRLEGLIRAGKEKAGTDEALARSIKDAANITLGYFFHTMQKDAAHMSAEAVREAENRISNSKYPIVQFGTTPDISMLVQAFGVVPNIQALSEAAQNSGYFNAFPDADGVLRWAPLVVRMGEDFYPSLSLSLLLPYLDWPALSLELGQAGVDKVRIGDTEIPTDESGRLLINYRGPAGTFPRYSAADIISGRTDPELLKDRIVLIGATAAGIYDLRVTPYSAVYPGVEVHANVIDNILKQDFIRRPGWTGFLDLLSIAVFGMALGIWLPRVKAVPGFLGSAGLLLASVGANVFVFSRCNLWLNLVYPSLTMVMVYTGVTVYKYVSEERERKKIRHAFQYYLTSSVINEMLKDPSRLKLGGDKKELTVMFSDIRGFTTISEGLTPEELVELLNEYLTGMTEVVFRYDGLLDKYIGDAIMAVFGAPLSQPDHAVRACKAALGMMERLGEFQRKWKEEGKPALRIGIGINSGEMVVGNMGSEMRFDYTVMGDNVNLASRLEGINKEYGTGIVIGESTHARVADRFICRELDSVRVKGKKLPVRIFELLAEGRMPDERFPFLAAFEEGLSRYKQRNWDEAVSLFEKVLEMKPGDPVSELYIRRCMELRNRPPEGEWDGVYTMTRK